MIQKVARRTGIPSLLLVPSLLLLAFASPLQGQVSQQPQPMARNADWNIVGDEIVVTYDLAATDQGEYRVDVTFLNETNKAVRIPVKSATGDIGTVSGPAPGKTFRWSYKNDIPSNMQGEGFYFGFEVGFEGSGEKSGSSFVVILLLLTLVGGIVFLIAGGSGGEE